VRWLSAPHRIGASLSRLAPTHAAELDRADREEHGFVVDGEECAATYVSVGALRQGIPTVRSFTFFAVFSLISVTGCARAERAEPSATVRAARPATPAPKGPYVQARYEPSSDRFAQGDVEIPAPATPVDPPAAKTFAEQRTQLYGTMQRELGLDGPTMTTIRGIFEGSPLLGQGRPEDTVHPMTRQECREVRAKADVVEGDPRCGRPNMVPIYNPDAGETADTATTCIDQFEFPNIACEYPVTYASALEASELCEAVGERLCDAHEWEGACAGSVLPPEQEYAFDQQTRPNMTLKHNATRPITWAYGPEEDKARCGEWSFKSETCDPSGLVRCGSNTYPAGAWPACVSPFGVYDQHGNAAEHMNLPTKPSELTSRGGSGRTEMKGSWFIGGKGTLYPDDCRFRAPDWHPSPVKMEGSHRNYHLGFRCCSNVAKD